MLSTRTNRSAKQVKKKRWSQVESEDDTSMDNISQHNDNDSLCNPSSTQDQTIAELRIEIKQKDRTISEKDAIIGERDELIASLYIKNQTLHENIRGLHEEALADTTGLFGEIKADVSSIKGKMKSICLKVEKALEK